MEFAISKSSLISCLNMVKISLPSKSTNAILKNVYVKAEDGHVIFRTTNTVMLIEAKVGCDVITPGECCLDGVVIGLITKFSDDKDIKFKLGEKLVISQSRRRHKPEFQSSEDYPVKQEIVDYKKFDPSLLYDIIQKVSPSASGMAAHRPILQGVHINPHDGIIIASDGNQVSLWQTSISIPGNIATLHSKMLISILPFFNPESFGENDSLELSIGSWTGIKGNYSEEGIEWEIQMNSLFGDFPSTAYHSVNKANSSTPKLMLEVEKGEMENIFSICKLYSDRAFAEGRANQTILSYVSGEGVTLSMDIPNLVHMEEHLECTRMGDAPDNDFTIWLDSRLLHNLITNVKSDAVVLQFYSPRAPFVVKDKDVEEWTYLQVPMVMPGDNSDNSS